MTSALTTDEIAELEAKLAKATPGPWTATETIPAHDGHSACWQIDASHHAIATTQFCYANETAENADLIVAAINALPSLIASAKRCAELKKALADLVEEFGSSIEQYDKVGPDFTLSAGTECFEASVLLDRRELIERARALLARASS